jgi:hypothetical protein
MKTAQAEDFRPPDTIIETSEHKKSAGEVLGDALLLILDILLKLVGWLVVIALHAIPLGVAYYYSVEWGIFAAVYMLFLRTSYLHGDLRSYWYREE